MGSPSERIRCHTNGGLSRSTGSKERETVTAHPTHVGQKQRMLIYTRTRRPKLYNSTRVHRHVR